MSMAIRSRKAFTLASAALLAGFVAPGLTHHALAKDIRAIVGFPAGGGVDTSARLFFRYFAKHNDGKAPVIQSMPGAAGVIALNYAAARAPRDGSEIVFDIWSPVILQLTKQKNVRYDYTKLSIIGAMTSGSYLMFTRKAAVPGGVAQPGDLLKGKGLIFAGQNPRLVLDIYGRLALNLLGVDYKYVPGYRGAPARLLAIRRNEADIATVALQGYRAAAEPQLVKTGHAVPLWYFANEDAKGNAVKDPNITDIPMFRDVYAKVKGKAPSGPVWDALRLMSRVTGQYIVVGPPGMDKGELERLRKAFYATVADKEYQKEAQRILGFETPGVKLEDALKLIDEVSKADPAAVAEIAKLMQ
ncbi:MAG: Bug family tripartite tricarboxylate transporter substrate binding protein [Beijerinckiaceae bacterium]